MNKHYLTPYILEATDGGCLPLADTIWGFLDHRLDSPLLDEHSNFLLRVRPMIYNVDESTRFITFEAGRYGYSAELVNTVDNRRTYTRRIVEAELLPFSALFWAPSSNSRFLDKAILILERIGNIGIKNVLGRDIIGYFRQRGCKLKMEYLLPDRFLSAILSNHRITKIRLIKHSIPADFADERLRGWDTHGGTLEMVLKLKQGFSEAISGNIRSILPRLRRRGATNSAEGSFWRIGSFDYDNVKIEVDIGGGKRTIDLANIGKINPSILVSSSVEFNGENGLPTTNSMLQEAKRLLEELKEELLLDHS